VGQLVGAILFSGLAEKFGRVRIAATAVAIMSVMSLGCTFAWSFSSLLACRLVQGVGIGGEMPVAAAYISELSRARGRGRFFLLYEMIFPIGLMVTGQVGALAVPALGWKSMFLIGAIPGLIITFLLARLPESPRWLISKGCLIEAEAIVQQLESSVPAGARRPAEMEALQPDKVMVADQPRRSRWGELLSGAYRTRTLIVWVLWASAYFVSNGLNNWMPSLYNTVYHLGLRQSLRAASMTNVAQVAVLLVCAFSIDRIGRRKWAVASFIAGGALLGMLGIFGAHSVVNVIIWGTLSYGIIGSTNAVLYLYTPEIYPTRMRVMGTGLATSWLRIASAVGPAIVGVMVTSRGIASVFLMFAGVGVIGALAATRMIETRGRRLEEIAA
jgi:putative MFS transporter